MATPYYSRKGRHQMWDHFGIRTPALLTAMDLALEVRSRWALVEEEVCHWVGMSRRVNAGGGDA